MEYFKPIISYRCRNEESSSQYLLEGDKDKGFIYFQYERAKNDYKGVNNCTFKKKVNGTDVNSEEKITSKFQEMKEEMRKR